MSIDQVLLSVSMGFIASILVYVGMRAKIRILLSRVEDISFKNERLVLEKEDIERKNILVCEKRDISLKSEIMYKDLFNDTKSLLDQVSLELEECKKWKEKYLSLSEQKNIEVENMKKKYDLLASQKDHDIESIQKKYDKLKEINECIHAQFNRCKKDAGFEELEREIRREAEHWKRRCADNQKLKKENENIKLQFSTLIREKNELLVQYNNIKAPVKEMKSKLEKETNDKEYWKRRARESERVEVDLKHKLRMMNNESSEKYYLSREIEELKEQNAKLQNLNIFNSAESSPEITHLNNNPSVDFYPLSGSTFSRMKNINRDQFRNHLIRNGFSEKYYKKAADYGFWRVGKNLFIVRANQFNDSVNSKGYITTSIQKDFGREINWNSYEKNTSGEVKVNDMLIKDFNKLIKNYITY